METIEQWMTRTKSQPLNKRQKLARELKRMGVSNPFFEAAKPPPKPRPET